MKKNIFPKSQQQNINSNKNKILQNINSLFNPKSQASKNNINKNNKYMPNPFNVGNNKIKSNNINKYEIKAIMLKNNNNYSSQKNNNIINLEEDSIKLNMNVTNINNEIEVQKSSLGNNINNYNGNNNIEMGQSPIYEKEGNSEFIGQNSNDYKLIEQLLDNKKSTDKDEQKINLLNPININNSNNINNNILSPPNSYNNNIIYQIIPTNTIKQNEEKKSVSDDIRNQLQNINLNELNPEWFKNSDNYKDPLYFQKLKKYEFLRMGIKPLQLSDFLIGKKLGSGQFGHVYLAKLKSTQFICAIKVMNKKRLLKQSLKCINQVRREIEIQSHLHHPNILAIYNFFWDQKNIYLVIEYALGGELFKILHQEENGRFSEPKAAFYIEQVCNAIEYIHSMNILHRDIKPENILISNEVIKLADFGWSIHQKSNKIRTTFCGTAEYMPPEVINEQPHIPPSDLWCLGILIYELCAGEPPFTAQSNAEIIHKIKLFQMKEFPEYFSEDCKDLIRKLIRRAPKDRISIQEAKRHPWIVNNVRRYKLSKIN